MTEGMLSNKMGTMHVVRPAIGLQRMEVAKDQVLNQLPLFA